jgi:hypothetical protein
MRDFRKDHPNLTTAFSAAAGITAVGLVTANPPVIIAGTAIAGATGVATLAQLAIQSLVRGIFG